MNSLADPKVEPDPAASELLTRTARALFDLGSAGLAARVARLAVASNASNGAAHSVLAGTLDATGRFEKALRHWRKAATLTPESPRQRVNLALALLGAGDWESGLPLYESRLATSDWSTMAARPGLDLMRERLAGPDTDWTGRRVLVVTEQGLGDAIWAARFVEVLAARCGALTIATNAALRPLLARMAGAPRIVAPPAGQVHARINLHAPEAAADHIVPILSLPWLLGVRPADAPMGRMPYLTAEPAAVATWRQRYLEALPGTRRIIGLIWRANPDGPAGAPRSIPVDALAPLGDLADAGFVVLQGGEPAVRMGLARVLPRVTDGLGGSAGPPPLDAFAAAMAATDIVVSVDTMGAHLAGAMAHPAIVLLPTAPSFCGMFWGHAGDRCPWYPSLRLIRQTRCLDWTGPVAAVRAALDADRLA